ncbi:hypothetical protein EV702DRAFT_1046309 [Suillus placidus]|uniref:Uncharacterized protein n=1 Tax=Suillus placidus TaxID=48579 RepID=A0A9P6ZSW4_9AGAM|nr:hypothetical protein EV702DRAFT_1046309 [Suillus placidus]
MQNYLNGLINRANGNEEGNHVGQNHNYQMSNYSIHPEQPFAPCSRPPLLGEEMCIMMVLWIERDIVSPMVKFSSKNPEDDLTLISIGINSSIMAHQHSYYSYWYPY